VIAILLVGTELELSQAARSRPCQLALVRTEHDAGVLAHHVADELELGIAERGTIRAVSVKAISSISRDGQ
jgi:hypothetical protein